MSHPQQTTNPGRSENLAKQVSLAEAIASNITQGREGKPPASAPEPTAPRTLEPVREPEPEVPSEALEAHEDDDAAQGSEAQPEEQASEQEPDENLSYQLADFAEAAGVDVDTLMSRFELEVDGADGKSRANLKDVLNGYRWNAANTQRAQEIAEQRRQLEERMSQTAQLHDNAEAIVQAQWADVAAEEQALEQQYRSMPWEQLKARGDGSYADTEAQFSRLRAELDQRKRKLEGAYAQVQQERQVMRERYRAEVLPAQKKALLDLIPQWRDEQRAAKEGPELATFMREHYGMSAEEINNIEDARSVKVLYDLWELKRQQSSIPQAKEKARKAPAVLKPGQRAANQDARKQRRRKLANKLKASGRRDDLAALVLDGMRK